MKIFVINLEKDSEKRNHITKECDKFNLKFELCLAIDGKTLSDSFIAGNVYNYPECALTKGEIGCALSHYNIYKKIVENNIPYALILEDDSVLGDSLPKLITDFEKFNKKEGIFLLTSDFHYLENKTYKVGGFEFKPVISAARTNGYIITNLAAKKLLNFILPIRYEADMFSIFKFCTGINIFGVMPTIISAVHNSVEISSIQKDRVDLIAARNKQRSLTYKSDRKKEYLKILSGEYWSVKYKKPNTI